MTDGPGRRRRRAAGPTADVGMVTAELALALPAVLVVVAIAMFVVSIATARITCIDSAAAIARLVARGESAATVTDRERALGGRLRVSIRRSAGLVRVDVTTTVRFSVAGGLLPATTVRAGLVVADESEPTASSGSVGGSAGGGAG